jgi:uncharacterized protein (TIGR04255 family)
VIQLGQMSNLPKKLKHDSIVEAVVEIQFEQSDVGEVFVGKLAADAAWATYQSQRLPLADLPAMVRDQEPNFKHQPIIQLMRPTPGEILKIGHRVISLHALAPYPGWSNFSQRVDALISALFNATPAVSVHRLGLRYINALTNLHGMKTLWDLNFEMKVAGSAPQEDVVTAFKIAGDETHAGQVSIASPAYVQGSTVPGAIAFIDVDVFSPSSPGALAADKVRDWFHSAHDIEKAAFFSLWRDDILTALRED